MGSKTVTKERTKSSKSCDIIKGAHKKVGDLKGFSDNTQFKMDVGRSSEDEAVGDGNVLDDKTDSDEEMDDVSIGDEEDKVSGVDEEESGSDLDEEEEKMEDSLSDSSDEDERRTIQEYDGVEFSGSDDSDLDGDEEQQSAEDNEGSDIKVATNPAWAQAMAKVLRTQKPSGKKSVVLSKARTIQAAESAAVHKEEEPEFEIVGDKEVKSRVKSEDVKPTAEELLQAKRGRLSHCRVKQEDFDYNRERALTKIATKGVVQLFNAVRSQQKNIGSKLAEAHSTRVEEKLLKSIDKNSFLEHLTGKIRSRPVEEVAKPIKDEEVEIVLPKSWDELSKKVESSSWDKVIKIKDEPED